MKMNIIAERILEFWAPGRKRSKRVIVRIGAPECLGRRDPWAVSIEILGPGKDQILKRRYQGTDAVQALVLTLAILPTELKVHASEAGGKLTFFGRKDLDFYTPRYEEQPLPSKRKKAPAKKLAKKTPRAPKS
jgi:hypothetical protein